jgi:hypothetical protein
MKLSTLSLGERLIDLGFLRQGPETVKIETISSVGIWG